MCETTLGNYTYIIFIYFLVTPILRKEYYFVVEAVSDWNVGRLEDTFNGLNYMNMIYIGHMHKLRFCGCLFIVHIWIQVC